MSQRMSQMDPPSQSPKPRGLPTRHSDPSNKTEQPSILVIQQSTTTRIDAHSSPSTSTQHTTTNNNSSSSNNSNRSPNAIEIPLFNPIIYPASFINLTALPFNHATIKAAWGICLIVGWFLFSHLFVACFLSAEIPFSILSPIQLLSPT